MQPLPWKQLLLVVFASGTTGIMYQVLFLREIGLLVGSSAYATAITLAAFFLGISLGGHFWGRRSTRTDSPLRLFATRELALPLTATLPPLLAASHPYVLVPLAARFADQWPVLLGLKALLGGAALLPAAFCIGGALPTLAQHAVARPRELGRVGSRLYAVHLAGGATGAFLAAFVLPPLVGFRLTHLLAAAVNLAVAGLALRLAAASTNGRSAAPREAERRRGRRSADALSARAVAALAVVSGCCVLALEVLYTRMFSLVVQNSVYTFAAILIVFLASLALGAGLAYRFAAAAASPTTMLVRITAAAGIAVAVSPLLFARATGGLEFVATGSGWLGFVGSIFAICGAVLVVPGAISGTLFPYLLRAAQQWQQPPGRIVGSLVAANTAAGVVGSLAAGFLLLPSLGLWRSLQTIALLYLGAAAVLANHRRRSPRGIAVACLLVLPLLAAGWSPPEVRLDPSERLLDLLQGADGTVATVEWQGERMIRLNSNYNIGGTAASLDERRQAHLPLLLHSDPSSVFFLGLGTGITAGAALQHAVDRVVACDVVPQIVAAARSHFGDFTGGLFTDARARVVVEDGSNYLRATNERYDVIVADLFLPWARGIGSLYSREHFAAARQRLREGGIFVQWLPAHQLTRRDYDVIARTLLEVFQQVTVWRGDFRPEESALALVATEELGPIDPGAVREKARALLGDRAPSVEPLRYGPLLLYVGNLSAASALLDGTPINTRDRPYIEYVAPFSPGRLRSGESSWLTMFELLDYFDELRAAVPFESDPYLANLSRAELELVKAGLDTHRAHVLREAGRVAEASEKMQEAMRALEAH